MARAGIAPRGFRQGRQVHGVELSPLRQLRMGMLPKMVSWYDPRLLARIGVRTIISSVFGQYADQRLIQAVTDPCTDDKDLCSRYDYSDLSGRRAAQTHRRRRDRRRLDRLHRRRGGRVRGQLCDGLPARPGQSRRPAGRPAAARRGAHHGRRSMLPAGHARGIQEATADTLQLGVQLPKIRIASCSRSPATTTGTMASTSFDSLFCRRATAAPRAT